MREIWFESAGSKLFAVASGEGPTVILLHGGLATHQACRRLGIRGCRLVTPDLRGSGRSIHAGPLTWDLLADDVAALVHHLGVARAVIGGLSFGAGCAVRVALRHPALVEALLVLHPAYGGADHGLAPAQQAAMAAIGAAGRRVVADGMAALFPLLDALPADVRGRARETVATYDPASVAATTAFMASGAQPFARGAELAAIAAPALLVPGIDPQHPVEVADVYRRHLPACTVASGDLGAAITRFVSALV